jgi:DNA-directed RNA polymerase subunit RPC12/RpoP
VCRTCDAEFTIAEATIEGMPEITCPICAEPFDPREA